ncbi:MAG: Flp pilus assembly complex ATPase component TadA, partial [Phycisphaerae bacterium]|nr:Flp pilus assembly complex ATPase component TadA [Phycisphaerae bacterium]
MPELQSSVFGLPLFLAAGDFLVSFWKPVVLILPFLGWGSIVTRVLDKHAARFFLPREMWNIVHLSAGLVALLVAVLMPVEGELGFWSGFGAALFILVADIVVFAQVTNKDERVPDQFHLTLDFSKWADARKAKADAKKAGKAELVIRATDKTLLAVPATEAPEFQVRLAAEALLMRALDARASQVELAPAGKENLYASVMTIDGVRTAGATMPASDAIKIIDLWKSGAKLDVNERRKPLQGDVAIERGERKLKSRVASVGVQGGMRLTLLFSPDEAVRRKPEQLGMLEPQMNELREIVADPKGTVVLAGMPDGGRTTLMYSVLKLHDAYTTNVQTIELDAQDALEGIRQNVWDPMAEGPDFSTLTRSILRRDPDVVSIAEVPDTNTAKEVCKADQERSRIYVSVKAPSAFAGLQTWMKLVGDAEIGAKATHGVVAVRLVRKLCSNCRVQYQPAPDMLKKLGLPADKVKVLYKKGGQVILKKDPETCPACQGTGYAGQEGIFEVYKIGAPEQEL